MLLDSWEFPVTAVSTRIKHYRFVVKPWLNLSYYSRICDIDTWLNNDRAWQLERRYRYLYTDKLSVIRHTAYLSLFYDVIKHSHVLTLVHPVSTELRV